MILTGIDFVNLKMFSWLFKNEYQFADVLSLKYSLPTNKDSKRLIDELTLAVFVKILLFRDTYHGRKFPWGEHLSHTQNLMQIIGSKTNLAHFGKPCSFSTFYKRGFQYFTKPLIFQWNKWNPIHKTGDNVWWRRPGITLSGSCVPSSESFLGKFENYCIIEMIQLVQEANRKLPALQNGYVC